MSHTGRNRLHTLTRWPADIHARLELAYTDTQFAIAMRKCGCDSIELRRVEEAAVNLICGKQGDVRIAE